MIHGYPWPYCIYSDAKSRSQLNSCKPIKCHKPGSLRDTDSQRSSKCFDIYYVPVKPFLSIRWEKRGGRGWARARDTYFHYVALTSIVSSKCEKEGEGVISHRLTLVTARSVIFVLSLWIENRSRGISAWSAQFGRLGECPSREAKSWCVSPQDKIPSGLARRVLNFTDDHCLSTR